MIAGAALLAATGLWLAMAGARQAIGSGFVANGPHPRAVAPIQHALVAPGPGGGTALPELFTMPGR
jgi:hypothetical protein